MKINVTTRYPIFAIEVSQEEFNLTEEEYEKFLEFRKELEEADDEFFDRTLYDYLITNFKYETTDVKVDCDSIERDINGDTEIVNFEENE
jgi:hypothetical protein